jgi:hypothetical protein
MLSAMVAGYRIAGAKPIANAFAMPISLTRYVAAPMVAVLARNMQPVRQD